MSRSDMYRKLPMQGGDPRQVAEIVNNLVEGKSNNTGEITLATGNATTTTISDERIGYNSIILLTPISAAAGSDTVPYGAFQSLADQTIASTTAAYAMTLDTTDYSNGVYFSNSSRMNVRNAGTYNFQWSGQFVNTDSQIHDVSVWLRKNGTDITGSTGFISVPNSHGGTNGHIIAGWNYFLELAANDYIELYWYATSTNISLEFLPAGTSPTRPSTASLITTLNYVSPSASTNVYVSARSQGSATLKHFANDTADKTYGYIIVA
jgi:hypothetical protein